MSLLDSLRPAPDLRVLVVAGGGGIGAAIARAFQAAGSHVHVCDVDRSALDRLASAAPGITGSMADASVAADVERVVDDARGALGGLDVLVGHAGIAGPTGRSRPSTAPTGSARSPSTCTASSISRAARCRC